MNSLRGFANSLDVSKMADKKEEDRKEDDERLEYIYRYLALSRKIKADKWYKMLTNEEFKVLSFYFNFNLCSLDCVRENRA